VKRRYALLFFYVVLFILFIPVNSFAEMGIKYPRKFSFTGLIELSYKTFSIESSRKGTKSVENTTKIFGQFYKFGIAGYVYDPRLLVFSAGIMYRLDKFTYEGSSTEEQSLKDKGYTVTATFLPYRPVSLNAYMSKVKSKLEADLPLDYETNSYGMSLKISGRKIPLILFDYDHWDYIVKKKVLKKYRVDEEGWGDGGDEDNWDWYDEGGGDSGLPVFKTKIVTVTEKRETDRYTIKISDNIRKLNTRYNLQLEFLEYSSPLRNYNAYYIRTNTVTTIKKKNILYTSFNYSNLDIYDMLRFNASLKVAPIGYLEHTYSYEFFSYEGEPIFTKKKAEDLYYHKVGAFLNYRFTKRLRARGDLYYRFGERDGNKEDAYSAGLTYDRPIGIFQLLLDGGYTYKNMSTRGVLTQYDFSVNISTNKLRWSRVYTGYRFSDYTLEQPKAEDLRSTIHRFVLGISDKGTYRLYWNLEGEITMTKAIGRRPLERVPYIPPEFQTPEDGEIQKPKILPLEVTSYLIRGDLRYPINRRGSITLSSRYLTGSGDSLKIKRFYYLCGVNYNLISSLMVSVIWKSEDESLKQGRTFDRKIQDIDIRASYLWRRLYFSLEYSIYKSTEDDKEYTNKTVFMKVRRHF